MLNILCVIQNNNWMISNFVNGWKYFGADVEVFFYSNTICRSEFDIFAERDVATINEKLLEKVSELQLSKKLDLIFFSILDDYILVKTLKMLKGFGIKLVNYHADMAVLWYRSIKTAKYFDLFCCAQKHGMDALVERGAKAIYLPMAAEYEHPKENTNETKLNFFKGVTFLGAPISYRPSVLSYLFYNNIPIRIYGHHWDWFPRNFDEQASKNRFFKNDISFVSAKTVHDVNNYLIPRVLYEPIHFFYSQFQSLKESMLKKVYFDTEQYYGYLPPSIIHGNYQSNEFKSLVQTSAINIGFSSIIGEEGSCFEKKQVRLRDFEIPVTGGFYLAQYSDELNDLYQEGIHIEMWRNRKELLEKCRYYLANEEERTNISHQGQEFSLKAHTWKNRFSIIIKSLFIEK